MYARESTLAEHIYSGQKTAITCALSYQSLGTTLTSVLAVCLYTPLFFLLAPSPWAESVAYRFRVKGATARVCRRRT